MTEHNINVCCSPVLDTDEAQADLRFAELLDGQNKILVVSAVAPGSSAEKVKNMSKRSGSLS